MEQEILMKELLKEAKKRNAFLAVITCFVITFFAIFVAGFILFVPTLTKVTALMDHLDTAITQMQSMAGDMAQLTDGVTETVDKMNHVDYDTLNEAIVKLRDAVEPLSKVANFFK